MNLNISKIAIASVLLLCGCQKAAESKPDPVTAFSPPSATEAFDLQTRCAVLGQKILENKVIGSVLTQDQVSHYSGKDNRCYVRLTVTTADLSTPLQNFTNDEFLYDGQTGEMLAMRSSERGVKNADVYDDSLKKLLVDPNTPSTEEVRELIAKFMRLDRRP